MPVVPQPSSNGCRRESQFSSTRTIGWPAMSCGAVVVPCQPTSTRPNEST